MEIVISFRPTRFKISRDKKSSRCLTTHLTGEDSQICMFGGCLLITYVPFSPSFRVRTPLCAPEEHMRYIEPRKESLTTHGIFHFVTGFAHLVNNLLQLLKQQLHGVVREIVVFPHRETKET